LPCETWVAEQTWLGAYPCLRSPGLDVRVDLSLTERFLDAQFDGVLPNGGIASGDDDDLAVEFGPFVGERLDYFGCRLVSTY